VPGDGCSASCQEEKFQPGWIVITEIMKDPAAVDDSLGEWFELYNASTINVDINGWKIKDKGTNLHTINSPKPLILTPGAFFVLGVNANKGANGGADVQYQYDNFTLANGADAVILEWSGVTIDEVAYDGINFPSSAGKALALTAEKVALGGSIDNDQGTNWCGASEAFGAGDFGTPGKMNASCKGGPVCGNNAVEAGEECDDGNVKAGDGCDDKCKKEVQQTTGGIVITEIMVNPDAAPDTYGEWFEIYNASNAAIDINGFKLKDYKSDLHVIQNGAQLLVQPGQYVTLVRKSSTDVNNGVVGTYGWGDASKVGAGPFALDNDADAICIFDTADLQIDCIAYNPLYNYGIGTSMMLMPNCLDAKQNDDAACWFGASDACPYGNIDPATSTFKKGPSTGKPDRGTPGAENLCSK